MLVSYLKTDVRRWTNAFPKDLISDKGFCGLLAFNQRGKLPVLGGTLGSNVMPFEEEEFTVFLFQFAG